MDEARGHQLVSSLIAEGLLAVEALVERFGGQCCVGDVLSAADVCLIPSMYNARRFEVDLSDMPRLVAIDERLSRHDPRPTPIVSMTPQRRSERPELRAEDLVDRAHAAWLQIAHQSALIHPHASWVHLG